MKKVIVAFILIGICHIGIAQNPNRIYQSHNQENGVFSVTTNDGKYIFQFYAEDILETTFLPTGETFNTDSHAVVLSPQKIETTYNYQGNVITFGSDGISVSVTTSPFQISYTYKGKNLISEKQGYYKSAHEPMDLVKGNIVADSTEKISFNLTKDEVLYGAGARALGMNRRGYRLPLYNRAHYGYQEHSELMNFTMPIVLSSKMYMIHFDNAPIGYLDFDSKKDNTLTYETISGRKTYQVIAGESWYDVVDSYTDLTGKQPMLPRWALGNFSSRFGYHTQKETLETIQKFKEDSISVDAIILDLYWFGKEIKGSMGGFEFLKDSFPTPKQMINTLKSQDVETILITEPFVLTTSLKWDEVVENNVMATDSTGSAAVYDFYFGNTGLIDIYSSSGYNWFKNIYKGLSEMGVTGFWGDLGEPEVHPNWVQHVKGNADEVHNIYGHDWARLVYEASQEASPELRPFILMRAGSSGSQRYGLVPWTGDVSRSWGGLVPQPEIALQMGMQGIGFMHSDLGGFAGANLDDELYVRWLQYGVFQPIYRPHAHEDVPSEPVFRATKAKKLAKQAIELRYRLLPYNYNLMAQNHLKGIPLMRPLIFEEPTNEKLWDYSQAYLWGKDFLISPVLAQGKESQEVYFLEDSYWFDFYTDEMIKGGQTKTIQLKEESILTYVRAGAFIPLAQPMASTKDYEPNQIELHYFHHKSVTEEMEREFYMDDGKTVNPIDKKAYEILVFEAEIEGKWLEIDFETEIAENYTTSTKTIQLIIHNIERRPKKIKIGKQKTNGDYNSKTKILKLNFEWNPKKELELRVKL